MKTLTDCEINSNDLKLNVVSHFDLRIERGLWVGCDFGADFALHKVLAQDSLPLRTSPHQIPSESKDEVHFSSGEGGFV